MVFLSVLGMCNAGTVKPRHRHGQVAIFRLGAMPPFTRQSRPTPRQTINYRTSAVSAASDVSAPARVPTPSSDRWLADTLQACEVQSPPLTSNNQQGFLQALNAASRQTLESGVGRLPTTRDEEYRFTDISPLLQRPLKRPQLQPGAPANSSIADAIRHHQMKQQLTASIVLIDGVLSQEHSKVTAEEKGGVYVGSLAGAPADVVQFALGSQSKARGGPFATLNGALAQDVVLVYVPAKRTLVHPIHVLHLASPSVATAGSSNAHNIRTVSAPRLLVILEEGSAAEVVEEFAALNLPDDSSSSQETEQGGYFVNSVTECELDDGSELQHRYVQLEATADAIHFKSTLVTQGSQSRYALTEARLGGSMSRHDVDIQQVGPETETSMRSFLLAGPSQLQDLHSKLRLEHPQGVAQQLHKCIAIDATSRGVFDGNVRVGRRAQKTDAQQLSRNLLLAPRATVNVKPNLQIIADDVKCTHGCAVSDLEENELFYLRSRGIDEASARRLLVYSFGREVVCGLRDEELLNRVEVAASKALTTSAALL